MDLSERLRLRRQRVAETSPPAGGGATPPEGFTPVAELVSIRESSFPVAEAQLSALAHRPGLLLPPEADVERLAFFDTETTGLSAGAGTVIFLFGIGRLRRGVFEIQQYFLDDFPGEPEFLRLIAAALDGIEYLVSYNGRAFDAGILRTRGLMNRVAIPETSHLDLLYPARRLFSAALPDCRLSSIETQVLGLPRDDDIPGALIPEVYLERLRTGRSTDLRRVVEHHATDISSLFALLAHLETLAFNALHGMAPDPPADPFALYRMLAVRHQEESLAAMRRLAEGSDHAAMRACEYLAVSSRRAGLFEEALALYLSMHRRFRSALAGREAAKQLEHRLGRPEEALRLVEDILATRAPDSLLDDLHRRRERLLRKTRRAEGEEP